MGSLTGEKRSLRGLDIGKATAKSQIEAGCDIYMHYFSDYEGPKKLAALDAALRQKAAYRQADLTNSEAGANARSPRHNSWRASIF